jgi:hypothetical protein
LRQRWAEVRGLRFGFRIPAAISAAYFFSRQRRCRSDAGFRFLFPGMAAVYHFVGAGQTKG